MALLFIPCLFLTDGGARGGVIKVLYAGWLLDQHLFTLLCDLEAELFYHSADGVSSVSSFVCLHFA
jgi:hypothetical protein